MLRVRRAAGGPPILNGQYVFVRSLGAGAYGRVKLVLNLQDMQLYAVKAISKRSLLGNRRDNTVTCLMKCWVDRGKGGETGSGVSVVGRMAISIEGRPHHLQSCCCLLGPTTTSHDCAATTVLVPMSATDRGKPSSRS